MFTHFIITRFNLSLGRPGNRNIDPVWLERRFEIFERYCLPSVRSQSEQNFKWLVFFDENTPKFYREKIQTYAKWDNFIPIYVGHDYKLLELLKATVLKQLSEDVTHVITTRLDNDDAIFEGYVGEVQKQFQSQSFKYVSFVEGYVLDSDKVYSFKYPGNPFNSLIEKVDGRELNSLSTCFGLRHEQAAKDALFISAPPAWLQVIHGDNVANRTRGFRLFIVSPHQIATSFSIDPSCISVDTSRTMHYLGLFQDTFWYLLDLVIMQLNQYQFFRDLLSRSVRQSVKKRLLRI